MPNKKTHTPISGDVHSSEKHESALLHATGQAIYIDDIAEPQGCLHAYILQSPHAHARIISINTDACHIDGVFAVMTEADIIGVNDIAPVFSGDPVFAKDFVHYVGQPVLSVCAKDINTARKAAHLAHIEYESLPAILTTAEAIEEKSYINDEPCIMKTGDSDTAIKQSDHVITDTLTIGGQDHFYLEGQIALAIPDENNDILCWSSTQHPSEVQHLIAKVLDKAEHDVTVKVRRMGGGFGGKETQSTLIACIASLLADKTQHAVKLRLDRDDDMIITGKRHPFDTKYSVGFNDEGLIQGLNIDHALNCGMSADLSNAIADRALFHSDNCYYLENITLTSYRCKTNMASNTAFRGFGGPQGMLLIENIIDNIARYLNKESNNIRMINMYDTEDNLKNRCVTPYGMTVEDNILDTLIPELEENSDYKQRQKDIEIFNKNSPLLKKGIALTPVKFGISFTHIPLNQAGALIHIYKDGSIQVNHGGTEMGQGLHTKIAQIVAHEFQTDISNIKIMTTDTEKIPNTSATAASSGSDLNGKAAQNAAQILKQRLIEFASKHFNTAFKDISFKNNHIIIGKEEILFSDFIIIAYENRISLSTTGFYKTPKVHWNDETRKGRPFLYFSYGAAISEVIIDTLTGENKILRTDILHDVGKSLNPAIDIGQIEGAYIQGAGWLTTEELHWDEKGHLKTHAPSTYKIPTSRDIPPLFNVSLYNNKNREDTIHKSKAVGEPPFMLSISVFMAIKHAISSLCTHHTQLIPLQAPATPETILITINHVRRTEK